MLSRSLTSHVVTQLLKRVAKPLFFRPGSDIQKIRKNVTMIFDLLTRTPPNIRLYKGRLGSVPVKWVYAQESAKDFIVLYLHGGGFVMPGMKLHESLAATLASSTASTAVLPAYRLAPEHPFPAALDDCVESYQWLLEHGYAPERIVIAGDSAGGNLALATAIKARQLGLAQPAGIVMFSPALRLDRTNDSHWTNRHKETMLSPQALDFFVASYCPAHTDKSDECLSPLNADFRGLPPMRFYASNTEVLLDDARKGVAKAHEEGIDAEIVIGHGMPHAWPVLDVLPESALARQDAADFINACWRNARQAQKVA